MIDYTIDYAAVTRRSDPLASLIHLMLAEACESLILGFQNGWIGKAAAVSAASDAANSLGLIHDFSPTQFEAQLTQLNSRQH